MRALAVDLAAHLASGATTLCRCWRLERRDGVVLGFTDHDEAVAFDGLTFEATTGLAATGDAMRSGLSVGGLDIAGAFSSAGLTLEDLQDGRYDFAEVKLWLVNWTDPDERVVLRVGTIGEVAREDGAFRAEVRGPMQALETVRGRVVATACDATLGDARCTVDVAARAVAASVATVDGALVTVSGLDEAAAGVFSDGTVEVTSGEATGVTCAVLVHGVEAGVVTLRLRTALAALAPGDLLSVAPGCDKRFATCRSKFANHLNFQGFPHLPGNDRAFAYARSSS